MTDLKKNKLLFLALALFFFVFLEATLFFQTRMSHLSGPGETLAQLPIQGASTIGLLAFPLINRFIPENRRVPFVAATTLLGIVSLIGVAGGPTPYSIVAAGTVSFLLIGLAGGAVYWATCVQSRNITRFATFLGGSHALAMIAQIPLYGITPNKLAEAIELCIGITALSVLIVKTWPAKSALAEMRGFRSTRADKRIEERPQVGWRLGHMTSTALMVLMIALILLFALLFNTLYLLAPHDFTTWTSQYTDIMPRLVMAAGGLVAGILFDIKRGRFLGITMFWISLLAAAAVLGMQSGMPGTLGEVAYFLGSGAYMTFYTATFIWIAPHLRVPDFWSGMGRALNNLTAIAVGAPSLLVVQSGNPTAVTATLIPLLVAINALLFAVGMMDLRPGRNHEPEHEGASSVAGAPVAETAAAEAAVAVVPIAEAAAAHSSANTAEPSASLSDAAKAPSAESPTERVTAVAPASATTPIASLGTESKHPGAETLPADQSQGDEPTPEERLQVFTEVYGLTPRESEVLAAVTADDRPLKQIAVDLGISLRVVQRHLTSLYQKTNTQTRVGLTMLYWQ